MLGKRLGEIERLSERMGAGIEMTCWVEGWMRDASVASKF